MNENPVILVVEDDQFNYDLLAVILAEINAKVLWASSASEGLGIFTSENIDLVLMDIKLPDKNGYELTKEFKSINPRIPIIAQTAYALTGDREKSMEAGCDDYISKPIRKAKLIGIIRHQLGLA
ncbi:MAG: response regulator [Bacteroidales bacterium]|nr:response regulator [Bacteroidales bacterium]